MGEGASALLRRRAPDADLETDGGMVRLSSLMRTGRGLLPRSAWRHGRRRRPGGSRRPGQGRRQGSRAAPGDARPARRICLLGVLRHPCRHPGGCAGALVRMAVTAGVDPEHRRHGAVACPAHESRTNPVTPQEVRLLRGGCRRGGLQEGVHAAPLHHRASDDASPPADGCLRSPPAPSGAGDQARPDHGPPSLRAASSARGLTGPTTPVLQSPPGSPFEVNASGCSRRTPIATRRHAPAPAARANGAATSAATPPASRGETAAPVVVACA